MTSKINEPAASGKHDGKHDGMRVVPADRLAPNAARAPGMNGGAAVNFARSDAPKPRPGAAHVHRD